MNAMKKVSITVAAVTLTAGAAFAAAHVTDALKTTEQKLSHAVVVESVTAAADGWVVIHAIKDGKPVVPASIGHTYVKAGMTENVYVPLTGEYDGDKVIAMLHVDDGEPGVYEFGPGSVANDKPVVVDGGPLVSPITIAD
tara:strand:+ start:213 stop:632 length:420 start_codon:yes stop_codon:yes gene_type:complete